MSSHPDHDLNQPQSMVLPLVILATVLACIGAFIYLSGAGDDLMKYVAERFFKYEAKAEEKALEKGAEGEVEGMIKDRLKKNPVVGGDELNSIQKGLGDEAMRDFGKGKDGPMGKFL
ncbi:MAG: hypothetical protein MMC33_008729 [Icmadophila ericetorum]|nr:hypothetical protein [Icmadophila ericetorum]